MGRHFKNAVLIMLCAVGTVLSGPSGDTRVQGPAAGPRLAPGPVTVAVKTAGPDGRTVPVPSAVVRIGGRFAATGPDGQAVLDGVPAGRYKMRVDVRGFERMERDIDVAPGRRPLVEAVLAAETLVDVKGRLAVEGAARPLAGAAVRLTPLAVPSVIQGRTDFSSDWEGRFTVLQFPAGRYRAEVEAPGCQPLSREIEVKKGMPDLVLTVARAVEPLSQEVQVRDSVSGRPVAGAKVVWAECWPQGLVAEARSGPDGRAVFSGVQSGSLNWMDAQGRCAVTRKGGTFRVEAEGYEPLTTADPAIALNPLAKIDERKSADALLQPQAIVTGAPVEFKIAQLGQKSAFRFRLSVPAEVNVTVGPDNPIQTYVRVLDAEGRPLAERGAYKGQANSSILRLRAGEYNIRIEAWDNNTFSALPMTLRVAAEYAADPFEPNDSPDGARLLRANEEVRGRIFPTGDVDFFRFDVPRTRRYRFTMPPAGFQRLIRFLDVQGRQVAIQGAYANAPIDLQVQLEAGRCTVEVHEWDDNDSSLEPYTLRLEEMADDLVDDSAPRPGSVSAVRALPMDGLAGSTINPLGDFDVYALSIPGPGVVHVEGLSVTQLYVEALAGDGSRLAGVGAYAGTSLNFTLPAQGAGLVYLRVTEWDSNDWSASPYKIQAWFEPADELDTMGRNDSFDAASPALLGESLRGSINPMGDVDIYRVEVDSPGYLRVQGGSSIQTYVRIFDAKRRVVAEAGAYANAAVNLRPPVLPGSYFIMVREWDDNDWSSRPYALDAVLERAEPAERAPLAADPVRLLKPGEAQTFAIDHLGDKDRFLFTIPQAGKFTIRLWDTLQAYIHVFDDQQGKLVHEQGFYANTNPAIELEAKGPTRYRLEIEEWDNNDFSLQTQYVLVDPPGRPIAADAVTAKADPFDPTLVTFTRTPVPGLARPVRAVLEPAGDGRAAEELPAEGPKAVRYPAEGLYTGQVRFTSADGSTAVQRFYVDVAGARERKGVLLLVDQPAEGQVIERDEPVRVRVLSYSGQPVSAVALTVDGRAAASAFTPPYALQPDWTAMGAGEHELAFTASDKAGESAVVKRKVRVSEYFDLQPVDGATVSGNAVPISWSGPAFGPARVRFRKKGAADWSEAVGENALRRLVRLEALEPGIIYEVQPAGGKEDGPIRSVTRVKGLAFGRTRYAASIARDYDQRLGVSVRNHADRPLTVTLECGKPPADSRLLAGFVGEGSEGAPFALGPGEEREFLLGISAQDVVRAGHRFPIRISSTAGEGFADEAEVDLTVKIPVVKLRWEPLGDAPDGLSKGYRLLNEGDGLTDLSLSTDTPDLLVSPSVGHGLLPPGGRLDVTVRPRLYESFQSVKGTLTARAVDKAVPVEAVLALKEGQKLFRVLLAPGTAAASPEEQARVRLEQARADALDPEALDWASRPATEDTDGDGTPDRRRFTDKATGVSWVGDDADGDGKVDFVHADTQGDGRYEYSAFKTGGRWVRTNLMEAWLEMSFNLPWDRRSYEKHDVDVIMNGVVVGRLQDTIPEGIYTFRVPPWIIQFDEGGAPAGNTFQIQSRHLRGGHYVVNTGFRLKTRMIGADVWTVAASREEAERSVRGGKGLATAGADFSVSASQVRFETPQPAPAGSTVVLIVPLRNWGAHSPTRVDVAVVEQAGGAPVELARTTVVRDPVGGYGAARLSWKAGPGRHDLQVVVDPDDVCGDTQKSNNQAAVSLIVTGGEGAPAVKIVRPAADSSVEAPVFDLDVQADGGALAVEGRVDGGLWKRLASSGAGKFSARGLLQGGEHVLAVRALYPQGQPIEQSIRVRSAAAAAPLKILRPAPDLTTAERRVEVVFECPADAAVAAVRAGGGPWVKAEAGGTNARAVLPLSFGRQTIEVLAVTPDGAARLQSTSVMSTRQPAAEETAEPVTPAEMTRVPLRTAGPADLSGPLSTLFGAALGPGVAARPATTEEGYREVSFGAAKYKYWQDETGRVTKAVDPLNRVFQTAYDKAAKTLTIKGTDGRSYQLAHDAEGRLVSQGYTDGPRENYQFDARGRLASVKNGSGETRYEYDDGDRVVRISEPGSGRAASFVYDKDGNAVEARLPGEATVTASFDAQGRLLTAKTGDGIQEEYSYDAAGRVVKRSVAGGESAEFSYGPDGRLREVRSSRDGRFAFEYDAAGNVLRMAGSKIPERAFEYDAANRLTLVREGAAVSRYKYDGAGNLIQWTDPLGAVYKRQYDAAGRAILSMDPLGGARFMVYDAADALIAVIRPGGTKDTFILRPDKQLALWAADGQPLRRMEFDAAGRTSRVDLPDRAFTLTRDGLGRLTGIRDEAEKLSLSYEYDARGAVGTIGLPEGQSVRLRRAPGGAPLAISGPAQSEVRFTYDAYGRRDRIQLGSALTARYTYTPQGQPQEIRYVKADGTSVYRVAYEYDPAGRVARVDYNGRARTYAYDENGRLQTVRYADGKAETYQYDAFGNIAAVNDSRRTYDAAGRIQTMNEARFTFDAEGRMTGRTAGAARADYSYRLDGKLAKVVLDGGKSVEYSYDAVGGLAARTAAGRRTYYLQDRGERMADLVDGRLAAVYLNGPGADERLARVEGEKKLYYITDASRSVLAVADERGELLNEYLYAPFGALLSARESVANDFYFQGRCLDRETGLYDFRSRWYDPRTMRFLQPDTLLGTMMETVSQNPYLFLRDDPVNLVDPWGMAPELAPTVGPAQAATEWVTTDINEPVGQFFKNKIPAMTTIRVPEGYKYTGLIEKGGWQYDVWIQRMGNNRFTMIFRDLGCRSEGYYNSAGLFDQIMVPETPPPAPPAPPVPAVEPTVPGEPVPPIGRFGKFISVGGKVIFVAAVINSGYNIYNSNNKKRTAVTEAGGWVGGILAGGFVSGALAGSWLGPPGAFVGGIIGFVGGKWLAGKTYDTAESFISSDDLQNDWYCTNRPVISLPAPVPEIAHRDTRADQLERAGLLQRR